MDNYHRITIRHFPDFVGLTLDQSLVPEHDGFFVIAKYRTHSEAIEGFRQLVQAYDQGERVYAVLMPHDTRYFRKKITSTFFHIFTSLKA